MTTESPVKTGSDTLDGIALEIREKVDATRKDIDAIREQGGTNDTRIAKLIEQRERDTEDLRKMGERVAMLDVDLGMDKRESINFAERIGDVARACYLNRSSNGRVKLADAIPAEYDVLQEAHRVANDQRSKFRALTGGNANVRDMGTTDDELGGALIPVGPAREFLDLLRARLVLRTLGATFVTGLSGHRIPMTTGISSGATTYFIDEAGTPTKSDVKFQVRHMQPHRMSTYVPVANNLLRWSPTAVQDLVVRDMLASMARAFQAKAIYGIGGSNQPKGLTNESGIDTSIDLGTDGGRLTRNTIVKMRRILLDNDIELDDETTGLLIPPVLWERLLTEGVEQYSGQGVDSGMPIHGVNLSSTRLKEIIGAYQASSFVATTNTKGSGTALADAIYGKWSDLILGTWGGFRIKASDVAGGPAGSAFLEDQTWIVIDQEVDALTRRPESFVHINHCTTS